MIIGFIVSILAIKFIQVNEGGGNTIIPISNAPSIIVAILFIPLYDMLRVFTLRLLKRKSPFFPDKTHVHHLLVKRNPSHLRASSILFVLSALFIIACFALISNVNPYYSFVSFFLLFVIYVVGLIFFDKQEVGYFASTLGERFPIIGQYLWKKEGNERVIKVVH